MSLPVGTQNFLFNARIVTEDLGNSRPSKTVDLARQEGAFISSLLRLAVPNSILIDLWGLCCDIGRDVSEHFK